MSQYLKTGVGDDASPPPKAGQTRVLNISDGGESSFVVDADLPMLTGAALVYHGYRRTGSIVWALLYGLAGKKLPIVAVPVALAQGFGQKKSCP